MKTEHEPTREGDAGRLALLLESRSPFLVVFVPLAAILLLTANLSSHNHIDPLTNSLTAWYVGMTGSVVMTEHEPAATPEQYGNVAWIVNSPRGPIAQYPPGAAALAAPFYRLWGEDMTDWYVEGFNNPDAGAVPFPLPSPVPATLAAALATAAALGLVAAAIPYAGGTRLNAVAAGYVGGLGTTMWATSSDALWQHGPAALWIALGVYLAARSRLLWSGLAFGAAIMTRPPIALMVAVAGIYLCIVRRSFRPGVLIGTGSVAGLGALLWYNWWVWGELTLSGGYGTGISENLLEPAPLSFVSNVVGAFVDPERGLLMYSPFLILLIPGLREAWRRVPDWARAAALGAAVYFVFQLKANRFSGGSGFIGYRYPLEALTAAAVLLAMSYPMWIAGRQTAKRLFWIAVVISLVPTIYWKAVVVPVLG